MNPNNAITSQKPHQKILIADDDPAICDAIQFMLEEEGYIVTTTINGATILDMEKDYPDLLLLDIWMSGSDGREICKRLKKSPETKDIPVIMISASRDIAKSAKDAGADDFLAKPFTIDDLLDRVAKHINHVN